MDSNTVVVVFHMKGCPACEDYIPRFKKIAAKHKVPTYILDVDDHEREANHYAVQNMPTTMVMRKPSGVIRTSGAIPNDQIEYLFATAERYA